MDADSQLQSSFQIMQPQLTSELQPHEGLDPDHPPSFSETELITLYYWFKPASFGVFYYAGIDN